MYVTNVVGSYMLIDERINNSCKHTVSSCDNCKATSDELIYSVVYVIKK